MMRGFTLQVLMCVVTVVISIANEDGQDWNQDYMEERGKCTHLTLQLYRDYFNNTKCSQFCGRLVDCSIHFLAGTW